MSRAAAPTERFVALDSCRGICACLVALYHFNKTSNSLVEHSYLFVDFFFVLSGFVIAHSYVHRLHEWSQLKRFIVLRLGRVYPLHLFVLGCYIVLEASKLLPIAGMAGRSAFDSSDRNIGAIASNVLMLHSVGIHQSLTWNRPSWSISAELWCYLLFGVGAMFGWLRNRVLIVSACAAGILLLAFSPRLMDATFDFGLVRCICGFSIGVLCQRVYASGAGRWLRTPFTSTLFESIVVGLALGFVVVTPDLSPWTVVAPAVFAPAVLVLAFDAGRISTALAYEPLQKLGLYSYSIYMTHGLVKDLADAAVVVLEGWQHLHLSTVVNVPGSGLVRVIGVDSLTRFAASLLMLAATIAVSSLTYRLIETPFRAYSRRIAQRFAGATDGSAGQLERSADRRVQAENHEFAPLT